MSRSNMRDCVFYASKLLYDEYMSQKQIKKKRKAGLQTIHTSFSLMNWLQNLYHALLKEKNRVLEYCVHIAVFLYSTHPETDRDWGWHYKYGEHFVTSGRLLMEDIYSWTMTGYEWVNHSWAYDIILYLVQNHLGMGTLSVISGAIVFITYWLLVKPYTLNYWKLALSAFLFVSLTQIGVEQGLRSQVVTLMFYSILVYILEKSRKESRRLFFLLPLFLVWTNTHADFVFGVLFALLFISIQILLIYYQKGGDILKIAQKYIWYFLGILAVTLLNPFTFHIYTEAPRHLTNEYLRNVLEWGPLYEGCSSCNPHIFLIYVLAILCLSLWFIAKKRLTFLPYIVIALIFLWPTIHTRRYEPIYVVLTFPILLVWLSELKTVLQNFKVLPYAFTVGMIALFQYVIPFKVASIKLTSYGMDDYCRLVGCSVGIIQHVKDNPPNGRGLNFYDWGGYLIGNDFPAKLFIDGRMHVWKDQRGYQAFADYIDMYYNGNYELFLSYNFDWLLIPNNSPIAQRIMTTSDLGVWRLEYKDGQTNYFVRVSTEEL